VAADDIGKVGIQRSAGLSGFANADLPRRESHRAEAAVAVDPQEAHTQVK